MYVDDMLSDFERTVVIETRIMERSAPPPPPVWQCIYCLGGSLHPLLFWMRCQSFL